jgi:hypothetical protein
MTQQDEGSLRSQASGGVVELPENWTTQLGWLFDVANYETYSKVVRLVQMWQGVRDGTSDEERAPGLESVPATPPEVDVESVAARTLESLVFELREKCDKWDREYGACGDVPEAACGVRSTLGLHLIVAQNELAADPLEMVSHPELDFPDCLTEFHRGVVYGYSRAVEEFADRCFGRKRAEVAQLWDAIGWLEDQVQKYRDRAAQVQTPSGVDLPEVEAAPPYRFDNPSARVSAVEGKPCDTGPLVEYESFPAEPGPSRDSATSEASKEAQKVPVQIGTHSAPNTDLVEVAEHLRVGSASTPPAAGEADTTPRQWEVDSPEPEGTGLRVRGDVNEVVFERREVVHNPARWRALPPEGDGGYYSWRSLNHELYGDAQSFTEVPSSPSPSQGGGTDG